MSGDPSIGKELLNGTKILRVSPYNTLIDSRKEQFIFVLCLCLACTLTSSLTCVVITIGWLYSIEYTHSHIVFIIWFGSVGLVSGPAAARTIK